MSQEIPADAVRHVDNDGAPMVLVSLMTGEIVRYRQPVPSIGGFRFEVLPHTGPTWAEGRLSILWDDGQLVTDITVPSWPWHRFTSAIEVFWVPDAKLPELPAFIARARR